MQTTFGLRAQTKSGDRSQLVNNDVAAVEAVEDDFMKAKDVNAIMRLCVQDNSLVVFGVPLHGSTTDHRLTEKTGKNSLAGVPVR